MLDQKTIELLEGKVFETLQIDKPSESGTASLYKEVSKIAVRATIITLQEYEKLSNENLE